MLLSVYVDSHDTYDDKIITVTTSITIIVTMMIITTPITITIIVIIPMTVIIVISIFKNVYNKCSN